MRGNFIPALVIPLLLAAPLCAWQPSGRPAAPPRPAPHSSTPAPRPAGPAAPRNFSAPQSSTPGATPQPGAVPRPPRQFVRGQGPHNGDWLRNTMQLPPEEQKKRLQQDQRFQQLPQQRQQQLINRLQKFNNLPPTQQQRVLNRMEMIEHLPPEQQQRAQSLFGQFRAMDPERKVVIRRTLRQMRAMPPEARERLLSSPDVQSRYSPQELQMLRGFNDIGFAAPDQP